MGKSFEVENETLEELLVGNSYSFVIPPFQRRFSWGSVEVSELLTDIFPENESIDNGRPAYFLGAIVLASFESNTKIVLDGQQRLTTISILLAYLRDQLKQEEYKDSSLIDKFLTTGEMGRPKILKLKLQPQDNNIFEEIIKNTGNDFKLIERRSNLTKALGKIVEVIDKIITERMNRGAGSKVSIMEYMAREIMYNLEFVVIDAPSESEAFKLFETLNDRGLALSAADLIKNRILSKALDHDREMVVSLWRSLDEIVGQNEITNYLRTYWIVEQEFVRKNNLYDKYREFVSKQKGRKLFPSLKTFGTHPIYIQKLYRQKIQICQMKIKKILRG